MILSLLRTRRLLFLSLLGIIAAGLGLMVLLELTEWNRLEAVTLNGQPVEDWASRFGLDPEASLFDQPLEQVAAGLLDDTAIARVDMVFTLPGQLDIRTNRFTPACFVLDRVSGRLLGLNPQGRVVPLASSGADFEHPVLTSVTAGRLFELCDDARVPTVVAQLEKLADDNPDLYRMIDEINFGSKEFVTISVSGLPYRLKANAVNLYDQLSGFIRFAESYQTSVNDAKEYDLRFDNMIVKTAPRGTNGR